MGFIYKFTSPSHKSYIGQTTRDINKRIKEHFKCEGHCILLENAIKKYGDNMEFEILLEVNNEHLNFYETRFIRQFNTMEPFGYNIRSGGLNGKHSIVSCERMRNSKLAEKNHNFGKPRTDSAKNAISISKSGANHHFYGKQLSDEHKLSLSQAHRKSHLELPMYLVYINERPEYYQGSGYAIMNHPTIKTKYFTSKKLSDIKKLELALEYLKQHECSSETKC